MAKESICRNCFHSYVCEQFNENKDDNNEKCHFFNDHYVPTTDVAPKSEVDLYKKLNDELEDELASTYDKLEATIASQETLQKALAIAKVEVAREIFEEIDRVIMISRACEKRGITYDYSQFYAELKMKYTEESQ